MNGNKTEQSQPERREKLEPKTPKILVVEDNSSIAKIMKINLKLGLGVEADCVTNGKDAVEKLRKNKQSNTPFDLVITDLNLGAGMDGFGLAEIIKKETLSPHVILLTASADKIRIEKTPEQLKEKGIESLMGKPFMPADLIECVKKLTNSQNI